MTDKGVTAIILAHYKEREDHLVRMVDDMMAGTVKPAEIVIFIDNPEIRFEDKRTTIIRSDKNFLPKIRFALGSYFDTPYCFFIDDDLSVGQTTLENFLNHSNPNTIMGYQGSVLGNTTSPYANDTPIRRGDKLVDVDIVLRTYFTPTPLLVWGLRLQALHSGLPRKSLDDVYLSLGNKYLNRGRNLVIPVDKDSNLKELGECGVGQSYSGEHYANRNYVCRALMDFYA